MTTSKLGKRIREIRKNAGLNQKEFCSLLNIPQSTLSAYETDRMQPTVATLINIATKFGVSIDWICGIENNREISDDLDSSLIEVETRLCELELQRRKDGEKINALRKELLALTERTKERGNI